MIEFNQELHTYTDEFGNRFESVNQFINRFQEEFDPQGVILRAVAKRDKITPEEVRAAWDKKRDDSAAKGTEIHDAIENYLMRNEVEEKFVKLYKAIDLLKVKKNRECEKTVYSDFDKIAGRVDLIEYGKTWFDISDFKTNESIDFYSKYGKYFQGCISHISDCKFNRYALQISAYAFLLEQMTGLKARQLKIIWIPDGINVTVIPVNFLRSDINNMICSL